MKGLRRVDEGSEASAHLGKFALAQRSVQLLEKGAGATTKAAGTLQKFNAAVENDDQDLEQAGGDVMKSGASRLRKPDVALSKSKQAPRTKSPSASANLSKNAGKASAKTARKNVQGAGGATRGKIRARNITASTRRTVKSTKAVTTTAGTTASKTAAASARAAAAVVNAARAVVAAVTSALSGTPVVIVVAIVVAIVVMVVAVAGWLIPGVQQERDRGVDTNYGIDVPPGPWGGWDNGFIPIELLQPIPWAPEHYLRADAVDALVALNQEFRAEFGRDIAISDAYRDYAGQVYQRQRWCSLGKCGNAAEPGTSNHGWALAADFGGGIASFGTAQYSWMKEHAPSYGWKHPAWAEPGGAHPEPWHWDFWGWAGAGGTGDGGGATDAKAYAQNQLNNTLQFQCLDRLWTGESNWNHTATNPSSGAYGIPQALPAEKMGSAGPDWRTNPITQVKWGLTYIQDRYGTPCDAWAFWNSKNPHWY